MKQFTFDTSNLPELQQDLHQIMMKNELRKGQDAFKLSHAGTKKSGYSFGPVQWDLANNEEARDHFIALMANAEPGTFTKGTLADMALELQTKGTRTETIETNRAKIDAILASRKGEQAIKEFYADSLQGLQGKVNDVIEAGRDNPNAKDFLESRQGRAMIGDWINQSGDPTQILNFVKGKDAELNGKIIKLESKLDVGEWQRYLYSTKYGAENPDDILRRLRNTIDTVPNEAAKPIETPAGDMKKSENEADSPHESHQAHADSPAETLIAQDRAQETERSQAAQAFLNKIAQPFDKPALTIALRDPASWTADEAKSVMADYLSRQGNDPFLKQLSDLTGQHMKAIYGDGALKYDATGKMIDPKPIRPYAPAEQEARTPEGYPLDGAINWAGERVANRIDRHGIEKAISWLQGGLNMIGYKENRLLEDGQFGPETDFAFRKTVAAKGPGRVEDGLALAEFRDYARQAERKSDVSDLADKTLSILGPLYRMNPQDEPKHESGALQASLNDLGPKHLGDSWRPLKLDDWIGPRTTQSFADVLSAAGSDTLAQNYGSWLGLIERDEIG